MFRKSFEKMAGWNGGSSKPFPKGIMDQALKRYNDKIINKGAVQTAAKKIVQEAAPQPVKMVHIEEALLHKLLARKK